MCVTRVCSGLDEKLEGDSETCPSPVLLASFALDRPCSESTLHRKTEPCPFLLFRGLELVPWESDAAVASTA